MLERVEQFGDLTYCLYGGNYFTISISYSNKPLKAETENDFCFFIRISKDVFSLLKHCSKKVFIQEIQKYFYRRFCYHFGFLFNRFYNYEE